MAALTAGAPFAEAKTPAACNDRPPAPFLQSAGVVVFEARGGEESLGSPRAVESMADDPSLTRQAIAALDAALVTQNPLERMRLVDRALRLHRQAAVGSSPEPQAGPTSQAQPPSAAG